MSKPPNNPTERDDTDSHSSPGSANARLAILAVAALGAALWIADPWQPSTQGVDEESAETSITAYSEGLTGRVVDTTGRPIQEAVVETDGKLVETDEDGRFVFEALGAGTHELTAHARGHARPGLDSTLVIETGDGQSPGEIDLVLPEAASLEGRVVAAGEPVEDAQVSISYLHTDGIDGRPLEPYVDADVAETDADGQFTLRTIAPGRLQILVEAGDAYAESDELLLRPGADADDVYVDLAPSGRLRGTIVDDTGDPVGAEISLEPGYAEEPSHRLTTDGGAFSIDALPTGHYTLEARADGFLTRIIDDLYVGPDEPTEIELSLQRSEGIVGRVLEPDGTPVAGAQVTLRSGDGEFIEGMTDTDENGRFQWRDISTGQWTVVATSPAHAPSERTPIEPDAEVAVEIIPGGNLVGRVLDHRRRPITDFTIDAHALEIHGDPHRHLHAHLEFDVSDARGRFDIGPIPDGRYRFFVHSPDHPHAKTEDIEFEAGQTAGPITVELSPGATVHGTVADANTGAPVEGAVVTDDLSATDGAETDRHGAFEIDGLPRSPRRLRIDHDDYHTAVLWGVEPGDDTPTYHFELQAASGERRLIESRIGVILGPGDRGFEILVIQPETPAADANLEVGDAVTAIDGQPTDEMTLGDSLHHIRGYDDSPVTLDIHRRGLGHRTVTVDRERTFTN